jgi:solute:Na+ symporter, SSS family
MGLATVAAFVPYLVIQLKAAGLVMEAVTGWPRLAGATVVYVEVVVYVIAGGVRGVGWTNVVQGVAMLVVIWVLGLWIPIALHGSIPAMFDRVVAEHPEFLTLPGPGEQSPISRYSSEILVSILGFSMWPHVFMKCFTARSARLVQLSVVWYPTFLFFLVPLLLLGYVAILAGGPADDTVLLWLVDRLAGHPLHSLLFAFVAFAVLAASMSTGDALLHAGGSILVRDVLLPLDRRPLVVALVRWARARHCLPAPPRPDAPLREDEVAQTRTIKALVVVMLLAGLATLGVAGQTSIVDLLLLAYAVPIQFLPLVLAGLYWRRAGRCSGEWGLYGGLGTVAFVFVLQQAAPELAARMNPLQLELGVLGLAVNAVAMLFGTWLGPRPQLDTLRRFELHG